MLGKVAHRMIRGSGGDTWGLRLFVAFVLELQVDAFSEALRVSSCGLILGG